MMHPPHPRRTQAYRLRVHLLGESEPSCGHSRASEDGTPFHALAIRRCLDYIKLLG